MFGHKITPRTFARLDREVNAHIVICSTVQFGQRIVVSLRMENVAFLHVHIAKYYTCRPSLDAFQIMSYIYRC